MHKLRSNSAFYPRLALALGFLWLGCGGGGGGLGGPEPEEELAALTPGELLFEERFDAAGLSSGWGQELVFDKSHYAPFSGEEPFTTEIAHSPPFAAHYFTIESTNERVPLLLELARNQLVQLFGGEPEEMYVEWWEYFDSAYCWPTSSQKIVRMGYASPEQPALTKAYEIVIPTRNSSVDALAFCGLWGDSSLCNVDLPRRTNTPMPLDRWVKLGFWVRLNTPGESDGLMRMYIDNRLRLAADEVDLRGENPTGLNYVWIGGNYSMLAGGNLPCSGHRYIDDIRIYRSGPAD